MKNKKFQKDIFISSNYKKWITNDTLSSETKNIENVDKMRKLVKKRITEEKAKTENLNYLNF